MSTLDSALLVTAGGTGVLALAAAGVWRLGIVFEREWLHSLSAPPAAFELVAYERMRAAALTTEDQESPSAHSLQSV
jgi:hypothetical protein